MSPTRFPVHDTALRARRPAAPLVLLLVLPVAAPGLLAASRSAPGGRSATVQGTAAQGTTGTCTVTGVVVAGETRLPGVLVTATPEGGGAPRVTSTGGEGFYSLALPASAAYQIKAELAAFATVTRALPAETICGARVDLVMTLASRVPAAARPGTPAAPVQPGAAQAAARPAGGETTGAGRAQDAPGQRGQISRYQRVGASATGAAQAEQLSVTSEDAQAVAAHLNLPPGFSADTMADTVTAFGQTGQINDMLLFGPGGQGMFGGDRGGMPGAPGMPGSGDPNAPGGAGQFGGGPGGRGGMGGPGMRGGAMGDRLAFANRMRQDQLHGQASYQVGGSPFDASPYSLTGQPTDKPSYLQQRFTVAVGGQFKIPRLFDLGPKTSFFLNYNGNHSRNAFNAYSTVPTAAERAGDFSAWTGKLLDPATRRQFQDNTIPAARIDPAALALLPYIPAPNQPGMVDNYYYSTTTRTSSDDINFRFIRQFGAQTRRGARGGPGGGPGGFGGGRGGGPFGGGTNLNVSVHYHRQESTQATPLGASSGTSSQTGWDIPVGVSFTTRGVMNQVRAGFNVNRTSTTNSYAGIANAAGDAGVQGISSDPADWGLPTLSFSGFTSLTDITPSARRAQTFSLSDAMIRSVRRHNLRWGVGFSDTRLDSRTDANARGTFDFTGWFTSGATATGGSGVDFADFLLGMPQNSTVQYGPGTERFRSQSFNAYFQDDWRISSGFTLNLGVRWEYQAPYTEADNRLVGLDVNSSFTAAVPVQAGGTGPYTGEFQATLVNPDRHAIAPRIGLAWRPRPKWVVRGGYGINYSSVPYLQIAQKLAAQPPFATSNRVDSKTGPLPSLETVLLTSTAQFTNNYGVDPKYDIGYVQLWNVDVQHDLTPTINVGVTYTGTHGSNLDILRAPNRNPDGTPVIPTLAPFIWESSGGVSTMHAVSFRGRKRLSRGFQVGGTYTYSKARDNASTLGGGGGVVAQDDRDLEAEWGPSSFDVRHRFTSDFSIELPFGSNRRWLNRDGLANGIFGGWMLNGTLSFSSGTPHTALVAGAISDVSNGVTGTLRANYNGQPITLADPTTAQFFNTAAFSLPAPNAYGTAGRDTIVGPGQRSFNMALMKSFSVARLRQLTLRIQANNVLNMAVWRGIDTTVNSPGFGRVTSVGQMRSVQIALRAGF